MHDPNFSDDTASPVRSLRDRLGGNAEERLGKALSELLESPLFTGAIGRAFDAREKAAQAQEVALGALNLPSAADIERLTRRIRSLSQRLESIEDGVERIDTTRLAERRSPAELEVRLERVEQQLDGLLGKLDLLLTRVQRAAQEPAGPPAAREAAPKASAPREARASAPRKAKPKAAARKAKAKANAAPRKASAKAGGARNAGPKAVS
jgi:hypothetical protein